jgi:predicted DNA-binding protein
MASVREPYDYEKLSMEHRQVLADNGLRRALDANESEFEHADAMRGLFPEHIDEITKTAAHNSDENSREAETRAMMLGNLSVQELTRMHKEMNDRHRISQRLEGVPEHEIMDVEQGFEVSGDAIRRLKAGKPQKLSTEPLR